MPQVVGPGGMVKPPYAMPPPPSQVGVGGQQVGQQVPPSGMMVGQKQPPMLPGQGMQQQPLQQHPQQPPPHQHHQHPLQHPHPHQHPQHPHQMPPNQQAPGGGGYGPQGPPVGPAGAAQLVKKELIFPHDSVESTTPVLYRRKRLTKADVCPVDPWRIFMAMRSGLLTECTWALDVLNVLLFDDSTVQFFGISNLPGLLTLLLEHFQKNLAEMFDEREGDEQPSAEEAAADDDADSGTVMCDKQRRPGGSQRQSRCVRSISSYNRRRHYENMDRRGGKGSDSEEDADEGIDLGQVRVQPNPEERSLLLSFTPNYTMVTRKGVPVRIQTADNDIFVDERQKAWDIDTNRLYEQLEPVGSDAWTYGFTEPDPSTASSMSSSRRL